MHSDTLDRLRVSLRALPASLPVGSSVYNFEGWVPDADALETYGEECCAFNAHLEIVFGHRALAPLSLNERGPGIESIIDIFSYYLSGDFKEKALLEKWVTDLTHAAEAMTEAELTQSKRVSKPSAAQKRSNDYVESVAEEAANRKRAKLTAAAKAEERSKEIEKTAQPCNWKHGFEDLVDVISEPKLYTTGRRGYSIINELVIECRSRSTGETRWRCASKGCQRSWTARIAQRVLSHATGECRFIEPTIGERASAQSTRLALGNKVAELDAKVSSTPSNGPTPKPGSQPSVRSLVTTEGRKAKQTRFDLAVVNFVCVGQIPPRAVNLPEFHSMISEANANLRPKSASYIAYGQIPMESARVRAVSVGDLRKRRNLTVSFDGGTAIRPQSFTTIHVTTPDTREAHLMEGIEPSGILHTGKYYFEEVNKVIVEIGSLSFSGVTCDSTGNTRLARELVHQIHPTIIILPDPCHQLHNAVKDICRLEYFSECKSLVQVISRFFSKSTFAATHLSSMRGHMGIKGGIEKAGKTRFAGWYYAAASIRRCLPAIEKVIENGVVEVKKDHKLYFMKNIAACSAFKTKLFQFEKLTEPFAKAIKCLESGHSNPSDVLIFNLAIMATLRQLFDNNDTELSLPDDVIAQSRNIANSRYYNMVLASDQEVYLSTFFLHPGKPNQLPKWNSQILRRNNLNPLSSALVLRPQSGSLPAHDEDLRRSIPSYEKIGLYLKKVLCNELNAGTIPAAKDYPDSKSIIDTFKIQFVAYARGEYPFTSPLTSSSTFRPLAYWEKLLKHPEALFLAPIAVKLFSLVPNSMAEERTVSCFSKLNSKYRAGQKVSTLVHMTRIRQHLLRKRQPVGSHKLHANPVLKFRDLSTTLLKPQVADAERMDASSQGTRAGVRLIDVDDALEVQSEPEDVVDDDLLEVDEEDDADYDDDVDDDEAPPEPVIEGAADFNADTFYGVDLRNPELLDLLSDGPVAGIFAEQQASNQGMATASAGSSASARTTLLWKAFQSLQSLQSRWRPSRVAPEWI